MNTLNPFVKSAGLILAGLITGLAPAFADPVEAEDIAYRMAKTYTDKSFAMAPTDNSGLLGAGGVVQFYVPVNKGLDYVFLAGTDAMAKDVDIYVYDEVGGLILDDRRRVKNAGVQFRSSYNGTALVYLHMANAEGLASWCVLVGRRGVIKTSPSAPQTQNPADPNAAAVTQPATGAPPAPVGP
ncbi:MAG: hypothetical protein JHC52_05725 [Chthoniobacterales bacterium]|nr:hypothetical protein [Chthoniobacterales bacterium]